MLSDRPTLVSVVAASALRPFWAHSEVRVVDLHSTSSVPQRRPNAGTRVCPAVPFRAAI